MAILTNGLFEDTLRHGKGKYTWKNGEIYDGNFILWKNELVKEQKI